MGGEGCAGAFITALLIAILAGPVVVKSCNGDAQFERDMHEASFAATNVSRHLSSGRLDSVKIYLDRAKRGLSKVDDSKRYFDDYQRLSRRIDSLSACADSAANQLNNQIPADSVSSDTSNYITPNVDGIYSSNNDQDWFTDSHGNVWRMPKNLRSMFR